MKSNLLSFYFGTIEEKDRLSVERALLEQPDLLVDYLDLKRRLEAAELPLCEPSPVLWNRLRERLRGGLHRVPRRAWFAIGAGIAVAASVIVALSVMPRHSSEVQKPAVLFDPGRELSAGSGVL